MKGLKKSAAFGLAAIIIVPALALAIEQALARTGGYGGWPVHVAVPYLLIYAAAMALALLAWLSVEKILPADKAEKIINSAALLFGLHLFIATVIVGFTGSVLTSKIYFIDLSLFAGLLAAVLLMRHAPKSWKLRALIPWLLLLALPVWIIIAPESVLIPVTGKWWAIHLLGLVLMGALALSGIKKTETAKTAPLAAGALIALALVSLPGGGVIPDAKAKEEPAPKGITMRPEKTPVVVIVLDTLRNQNMSLYGYDRETTPFLEELAKDSMVFTRFKSVATYTLPSHASLFTGQRPFEHGVYYYYEPDEPDQLGKYQRVPGESVTLAEKFSEQGYRTAAVTANYSHVSPMYGLHRGFELFSDDKNPRWLRRIKAGLADYAFQTKWPALLVDAAGLGEFEDFLYYDVNSYITAEEVNEKAMDWLGERDPDESFFLFLNYMEAHGPFYYPSRYRDAIDPEVEPSFDNGPFDYTGIYDKSHTVGERGEYLPLDESDTKELNAAYNRAVRCMDDRLRELFFHLKEKGIYDRALIVVLSDHGEMLGEKGFLHHANAEVYEEITAVPLIIKTPGSEFTGEVDALTQTHQLYGYILGCALEGECGWAKEKSPPAGFSEWHRQGPKWRAELGDVMAFYEDRTKIILRSEDVMEVYDLAQDPSEKYNLGTARLGRTDEGEQTIDNAKTLFDAVMGRERSGGVALTAEEVERLKALGYIQ